MEEDDAGKDASKGGETYEIYGTHCDDEKTPAEHVKELFKNDRRTELYERIVTCDYIIYNIKDDAEIIDEAIWMLEKLHENIEDLPSQKIFILLSSVLTWQNSPMLDEDKTKLLTYVIVAGVTYGEEQNVFHHFFKSAWNNSPSLIVPENGQNVVPSIHVNDLTSIIQTVMEMRPTKHYIIAKDESQNTLAEMVKAISKGMTTGRISSVTREETFLTGDFTQSHIDQLLVNLRMEASFVREHAHFRWHCENGLVEDIGNLIREFKLARKLLPFRICILGPPASGKTTLAARLCEYYKLHHLHIKGVVEESIANLKHRIEVGEAAALAAATSDAQKSKTTVDDEDEDLGGPADVELLESVQQNMEENNGRLDLDFINDFFREKLNSKPCQNQGYIIDGYPKSKKQAMALLSVGGEDEDEEEEENEIDEGLEQKAKEDTDPSASEQFAKHYLNSGFDVSDVRNEPILLPTQPIPTQLPKGLLPGYVFELQALDKFLRDRIMAMPESKVQGTHYTEAGLTRRLNEYRTNQLGMNPTSSTSLSVPGSDLESPHHTPNPMSPMASASINENSVRAYFDSKGVLQIPIDVMNEDEGENLEATFHKLIHFLGPSRNYGLTPEEQEAEERKAAEERLEQERTERERVEKQMAEEQHAREQRKQEWLAKNEAVTQEETELLSSEAEPLRSYLRKHVMPVLAKGLTECVRKRPEDPIDFLAEFLFFNNPQVD